MLLLLLCQLQDLGVLASWMRKCQVRRPGAHPSLAQFTSFRLVSIAVINLVVGAASTCFPLIAAASNYGRHGQEASDFCSIFGSFWDLRKWIFPGSSDSISTYCTVFTYKPWQYFHQPGQSLFFIVSGGFSEWICENTDAKSTVLPLDDPTINFRLLIQILIKTDLVFTQL